MHREQLRGQGYLNTHTHTTHILLVSRLVSSGDNQGSIPFSSYFEPDDYDLGPFGLLCVFPLQAVKVFCLLFVIFILPRVKNINAFWENFHVDRKVFFLHCMKIIKLTALKSIVCYCWCGKPFNT